MREVIFILQTFCFLSFSCNVLSQGWISLDNKAEKETVTMDVLEDNTYTYKVKYQINGIYENIITNERGTYHNLSFGESSKLSTIGAPSLPLINRFVAIPEGTSPSISIIEDKWTDFSVGRIYPAQKPTRENEDTPEFYMDEKVYQEEFAPQRIHVSEEKEWRGIRCVNISICPFQYYPAEGRMSVMKEFILQINFIHSSLPIQKKRVYENADPYKIFDNHVFSASRNVSKFQTELSNSPKGDLLIIVGENMANIINSQAMEEFRLWKAFKGIKTHVVSTAVTSTEEEYIRDYIRQQYNNGIRYVLFVGDETKVPIMYLVNEKGQDIFSDYWYGCLGGEDDCIADVPIGRFPTNQPNEFSNMVNKTIKYEKYHYPLNEALLVAYYYYFDTNKYMKCSDSIRNASYSEPISFSRAYGDSATNNDVVQHINAKANIINYRGHGGTNVWGQEDGWGIVRWNCSNEKFHNSQINNMNDNACSVFFSIACETGGIQSDSVCMLEAFTRAQNGAVAFVGATIDTYPLPNNSFNMALFHKLLNDSIYRIGDAICSAHAKCISQVGGNDTITNETALSYVLGGDPTLELWTKVPDTIKNVNFDIIGDSVYISFDTITNDSSYCSVVQSDDSITLSNVKFAGQSVRFHKPDGNFYAVINSHNYFPYIISCNFNVEELTATEVINEEHYYENPFDIIDGNIYGYTENSGVTIQNGGKLVIHNGSGGVTIYNGFECKQGGAFEIK